MKVFLNSVGQKLGVPGLHTAHKMAETGQTKELTAINSKDYGSSVETNAQ